RYATWQFPPFCTLPRQVAFLGSAPHGNLFRGGLQPLFLIPSYSPLYRHPHGWRKRLALTAHPLVFRVLDALQLGVDIGQCPEDLPPGFVLILQAGVSLVMLRPVQGGMSLLDPFALHGFLQGCHHEVGFLYQFVDQVGPFPWFHTCLLRVWVLGIPILISMCIRRASTCSLHR